jgi:AcrR family transcriptional regulator
VQRKRTRLTPEARADNLLDAAAALICRNGLATFTMEGLAAEASVSVPLVYNYFSSRVLLLQALLKREYSRFGKRTGVDAANAQTFEEIVRVAVQSNFEHNAPGTVLPMLITQPEIACVIQDELKQNSRNAANFLIERTAKHYQLDLDRARLIVQLSRGAAWAAAEWSGKQTKDQDEMIEMTVDYIIAGIEQLTTK